MTSNVHTHKSHSFDWKTAAVSGLIETTIRQPLMCITSMMISNEIGPFRAIKETHAKGGVLHFYSGAQGLGLGASQRLFHRITTFAANEEMRNRGYTLPSIAAVTATLETISTITGEMFLTVSQTQNSNSKMKELIKSQIAKEGWRSLSKGMVASMGRNLSFNGAFFSVSYYRTDEVKKYPLASSLIAATSAVFVSHIFEVIRVKKVSSAKAVTYTEITTKLYSNLGSRALVVGIVPRLLSVGAGSFIAMGFFNKFGNKEAFNDNK